MLPEAISVLIHCGKDFDSVQWKESDEVKYVEIRSTNVLSSFTAHYSCEQRDKGNHPKHRLRVLVSSWI